jgi:hypothetical protein
MAKQLDIPSVSIRSSQQFSFVTFIFQVSPVLSCTVALVPVVLILSGLETGSGGCNMTARLLCVLDGGL